MTTAAYIRRFIRSHPEYKHDSFISDAVNYDVRCGARRSLTPASPHTRCDRARHSRSPGAAPGRVCGAPADAWVRGILGYRVLCAAGRGLQLRLYARRAALNERPVVSVSLAAARTGSARRRSSRLARAPRTCAPQSRARDAQARWRKAYSQSAASSLSLHVSTAPQGPTHRGARARQSPATRPTPGSLGSTCAGPRACSPA